MQIDTFDTMGHGEAAELLRACCASGRWVQSVLAGRPYRSFDAIAAACDAALAELAWPDILEALAAHPRIGERMPGAGRESAWSRAEQSGAADPSLEDELVAGNLAYEQRFGHVFLICATGRSAGEILSALRQRLGNPAEAEELVVRHELREIVRLRLIKTFP
jgi:2-oxo-4-hydroxy-4-carboxy-5-ureidoimidazoline decarboxylase